MSLFFGALTFTPFDAPTSQPVEVPPPPPLPLPLPKVNRISPTPTPLPKKKLLWQLDYKSVPYYVRTYNNELFVCDKYGARTV